MKLQQVLQTGFLALTTAIATTVFATEANAGMRAKMYGAIARIEGSKVILNDGNGQVVVDTKSSLLKNSSLAIGDYVVVEGEYDKEYLEAYTITRSGETIPKYKDDTKAPN